MATKIDPRSIEAGKLIDALFQHVWQYQCELIAGYIPPYPRDDTKPKRLVVYYPGCDAFLRYSRGPVQGYFWDAYGDDLIEPEFAIIAISRAPSPTPASITTIISLDQKEVK